MNLVDVIVLVLAVGFAVSGFRNGAVVGLFSFVGFFGGGLIGAQLARPIGSRVAHGQAQVPVAIVLVLVLALIGQLILVWIAGRIRNRLTWRPVRAVDSGIGAVFGVVSVLLVTWMIALPLTASPFPTVVSAVRNSVIVKSVNTAIPSGVRDSYSSLRQYVDRSGFPPVFGDFSTTEKVDVAPPVSALAGSAIVSRVHPSVLKIYGQAPSCDRAIEGSGFVFSGEHVLTNAHVVAGTSSVQVQTSGGSLAARVVVYDPHRDVAVLYVPGLEESPLSFASSAAATNASAIVLGYPEDGPYDAQPARIRNTQTIVGHDIYGKGVISRQIYSIRATVRSGNSGGPLITPSGSVLGIVFATALDASDTGFVLTNDEIAPDASAGRTATAGVGTGSCTPG